MGLKFRSERGASAVEFAIVLPVLILLVFGIIEFSILLYDKAMVTNASREGARFGIVYRIDDNGNWTWVGQPEIEKIVNNYLTNNILSKDLLINLGDPTATKAVTTVTTAVNPDTSTYSPGGTLTVSVTYIYKFLVIPNFIASIIDPITLTAQTVMRFE